MIRRPPRSTLFPTRRSSDLLCQRGVPCGWIPRGDDGGRVVEQVRFDVIEQPVAGRAGARLAVVACQQPVELRLQRSEEHTSELQSPCNLVCRLLLEKNKNSD